jgi:hypothetical protein
LDANLGALLWSTLLGGNTVSEEQANAIVVDTSGVATIVGFTRSSGFQTTAGAFFPSKTGASYDGFVTRLNPGFTQLLYSTYFGGSIPDPLAGPGDQVEALALLDDGSAVLTGWTGNSDFPITPGAYQSAINGSNEAFLCQADLLPTGVSKYGASTPSCLGAIRLAPTRMPVQGDPTFALYGSGAPPGTFGILALGAGQLSGGVPLLGFQVYLDPLVSIFTYGMQSDSFGWAERALPIPVGTAGMTVYLQCAWFNTAACGGVGTFSASNALSLTVQP